MGMLVCLIVANDVVAQTNCRVDSTYIYNASNQVILKNFFTYDGNGWQTQQLTKDSANGIWKNTARNNYSYNASGRQIENLGQVWVNNSWRNSSRRLITYTANDAMLTDKSYYWDTLSASWILNGFQHSYTYNANDEKIMHLQAYLNSGVPSDSSRTTYTYDANSNEITNLREGWTSSNPVWKNIQKWYNVYTSNNLIDSSYNLIWNINTLVFDTSYLTTYGYDAQENKILYLNHQRNGASWVNSSKHTYTFDANNNNTTNSYYNWDNLVSAWTEINRNEYTFNGNNAVYALSYSYSSLVGSLINSYQTYYYYDANDNLDYFLSESWNTTTSAWDFSYKLRYFYDCTPLAIEELSATELRCYPNPVNDMLKVELATASPIAIVSITGTTIATYPAQHSHVIDVSSFPAGVYFVKTNDAVRKINKL